MSTTRPEAIDDVTVHLNPVWRSRANCLVSAPIEGGNGAQRWEQLWARQRSLSEFEVCCIPFFAPHIDLGDRVQTRAEGDHAYVVTRVLSKSGRFTFRAWFTRMPADLCDTLVDRLQRRGCLLEWHSPELLGIDAARETLALDVEVLLTDCERLGYLTFERGHAL